MVVVTLPLGRLADRVGARPLVACAGAFVVLGSLVLALAGGLPALLAGRTLIGIANGIIWTAGVMIAGAPGRPAGATGRAIAAGGSGLLVGPVLAGLLADRVGTWAPFAIGAALALPVTIFFALQRSAPAERPRSSRATGLPAAAHRNRLVVYAMLATVLLGFVGGMGNLLGSLRLSENGLSPSGIGVLFSLGALVWIAVAPLAGRSARSAATSRSRALGCALLGAAWLVPVADALDGGDRRVPARLDGRARGAQHLQLPARGQRRRVAGAGRGTVIGLVNLSWGVAAVIGPLAASAAHGAHRRAHALRRHRGALPAVAALSWSRARAGPRAGVEPSGPAPAPISSAAVGMSSIEPQPAPA